MGKIPIRRALIGGGLEREVEKIRRLATCIGLLFQYSYNFFTGLMSQDPLNMDESSNVDDKAPLWIYVNKIEKLAGGGSWRFECKFCSNSYVGSHSRVMTHLLQGGKGIK
ncbi:hypothetical protein YC2023_081507 [Brassica napus]